MLGCVCLFRTTQARAPKPSTYSMGSNGSSGVITRAPSWGTQIGPCWTSRAMHLALVVLRLEHADTFSTMSNVNESKDNNMDNNMDNNLDSMFKQPKTQDN